MVVGTDPSSPLAMLAVEAMLGVMPMHLATMLFLFGFLYNMRACTGIYGATTVMVMLPMMLFVNLVPMSHLKFLP